MVSRIITSLPALWRLCALLRASDSLLTMSDHISGVNAATCLPTEPEPRILPKPVYTSGPLYHLLIEYGIERAMALYDPGAMISLMRESVLKRFLCCSANPSHVNVLPCDIAISAVNSTTIQGKCLVNLKFCVRGYVFTHTFVVVRDQDSPAHEMILGQDFWHKHLLYVDTRTHTRSYAAKVSVCFTF